MKKIFRSSIAIASLFIIANKSHAQLASDNAAAPVAQQAKILPVANIVAQPATASSLPLAKTVATKTADSTKVAIMKKSAEANKISSGQGAETVKPVPSTPVKLPAIPTQEVPASKS